LVYCSLFEPRGGGVRISKWKSLAALVSASAAVTAHGQTSLTGGALALQSGGSKTNSNATWTLTTAGYAGTYLTVPTGGATINFTVNANESSGSGANPHMDLVIADTTVGFNVNSTLGTNYSTGNITLPAGTYLVEDERDYSGNVGVSRSLSVNNLSVNTVSGSAATFSNTSTDANALTASDTYINNFRKGGATVTMTGPNGIPMLAGTPISVNLARNAFAFGTAVPGSDPSSVSAYMGGPTTAQQLNYQSHLNQNFNAVSEENAGKWGSDEGTQGSPSLGGVDNILNYAQTNQMTARMHNLIWGSQQPTWVGTLLTNAGNGVAGAQTSLSNAITSRINYTVGTGTSSDRDLKYGSIDVYNESYHTGASLSTTNNYWHIYGASGIAGIYNQVASAISASGSSAKTYTNEYNVLQNNGTSYGTFYATNIDQIRDAGGNVGGVGIQYYPSASIGAGDSQHSPARIESTLANLAAQGLPMTLTEFGVASGGDATTAATILQDSMRLMYGSPQANGFYMWGFQAENGGGNLFASAAALYTVSTSNWNSWTLTAAGKAWQDQLGIADWDGNPNDGWTTNFSTTLNSAGTFSFPVTSNPQTSGGFYGDYYLSGETANSQNAKVLPFDFTLTKGTTTYNTTVAKPTNWFMWKTNTSGNWSTGTNWTDAPESGATPNTAGYTAYFGSSATVYNMTTGAPTTTNITGAVAVNVDSAKTVGMLAFDSANSYTLSGSGITLQGYDPAGNVASIYVNNGSHTINSALTLADDTTVTVGPVASTLTVNSFQSTTAALIKAGAGSLKLTGANAIGGNITINAGPLTLSTGSLSAPNITVNVGGSLHYDGGTLAATNLNVTGGLAAMAAAGNRVMTLNSLTISGAPDAWVGKVDLNNNGLIVHNGDNFTIFNQLKAGFNAANGYWNGTAGIVSTSAAGNTTHLTTLGYGSGGNPLDGVNTASSDILVKYTYFGDANLDGTVNGGDYQQIDNGFGMGLTGWSNGDFNYDGVVDGSDYSLIDNTFNQISATGASPLALLASPASVISSTIAAVPEPGSLSLIIIATAGIFVRRKRKTGE
jgi:autotransporter-associated beta strand protein